ncbi:protein SCAF11 [Bombina bombina]|uniref:protein SCAF11 n=1 Tax=Bombina bombina TaxID=8345 RepID=UPI00235AED54|nr:protein SCAF11 [Bombina bombina]
MKNKLVCTPGAEDQDEENESITNDVSSYAKQRCPICLNFLTQDVGIPENCYHAFCVACILKWSETSTSCPVDRKLFKAVYKINQSGAFTKIQVKSRRLKETHDSCYSSCNHSCSLCSLCNKICIRTEADRALQNQSLECDKVQKGCIINKEKNESEPEINSLSCTSSCFTDIAASCKPSSLIPVIPYCTDINAEVPENKEMDLIIQKREEMKYLQSRSVMPGIQSTCFSMDTGTLTRPVVSSRLNEFIFHLNYFSVHNKGFSKRMCVLSAVQEGTEKKQTTSGSSNRRGTKKKPVYSSTRRRSTRNSKSEDMGESQGSPKSSNSDRDTSGCNSSSTNVSSSENCLKQTPKQRKRPTKKGSQVRRRLRSSAQTEEVSSESEANSANETEQESEEKQLSEEIQSEMDIVKSDTEATCASKEECGQSPSSPSIENMSKEQLASLSSLKQSDVDLPHYPSLQSEQNCGFGKPASPVLKNEMFKQDLLPASPASEIHLESETAQLQDLSDTEMQTEQEQECASTSEKQDLEGIETPGSPFSKNNHSSENESSQSFHSPMMQQEIEVEDSVLSSDSEHQEPKGLCVLDSLEENLQDSKHEVLESSISLKEQHSEDNTDVSVLENAELLSPTPSENVDNHSEGSLISFTLNRVEQSEVVCSNKDHDDSREKCILEPGSSEDSSKTNISTELNVVVPMDTFILEQKSNLDIQINNLAGSVKETEQIECFEESATATCILEDSEENTSSEKSVNKSDEDTEFAQTDITENVLDACENISEIIETKENSTSIESFESSLKPPAVLDECKITLPDNNENGNASIINCEQPTVLGDDDYDSVAMQCDSLSDQNDSEIDHPSEVKENFKLDLEVTQKERLNLNSEVAICTTEELNSPNTEPKQINNDKIKSDSRTRKSRFHSPSTQWSRSKSEVKERQRSRSPAKPTCKSRSRSPAKPTSKSRSRSPAKPTSKSRSRSPAKPTSKSRSRSRERDEREKGGQWKGRSRDHRTRKQSHSRSRTRSRSRSENRSKIRNRCIAPERNEKVCFSPPWKERWPPDNFKGSRGNERYKRNKQDRPREYFRNDWQDINKDKFEQHYEDKNKNDYPDWVVEQKSVKHRGRGQDRPRQSYRGSHWEDNQYNSRDSWNKNANLDWHSPRGGGFRGRGGFHGAFNHGDQNESRWNNRSSFSGNSGYEQSRFPEPRNYKPKFEQDQFGSPAARSGWSSTSSWAVRKTLPADVQNYYSKNSKRGRTTGLQSGWPKQDEPSDPDFVKRYYLQKSTTLKRAVTPLYAYLDSAGELSVHSAGHRCLYSSVYLAFQKVQIQERAAQEVKMAIKPYYQNKDITKEEYKEIVKKAVDKVCHSKSGEVDSSKVANLVKAYVDKYKHSRKKGPD